MEGGENPDERTRNVDAQNFFAAILHVGTAPVPGLPSKQLRRRPEIGGGPQKSG